MPGTKSKNKHCWQVAVTGAAGDSCKAASPEGKWQRRNALDQRRPRDAGRTAPPVLREARRRPEPARPGDGEAGGFRERPRQVRWPGRRGNTRADRARGGRSCREEARSVAATETPALARPTPVGGAPFTPVLPTQAPRMPRVARTPARRPPPMPPVGPRTPAWEQPVYTGASGPGSRRKRPHDPSDHTCA